MLHVISSCHWAATSVLQSILITSLTQKMTKKSYLLLMTFQENLKQPFTLHIFSDLSHSIFNVF